LDSNDGRAPDVRILLLLYKGLDAMSLGCFVLDIERITLALECLAAKLEESIDKTEALLLDDEVELILAVDADVLPISVLNRAG